MKFLFTVIEKFFEKVKYLNNPMEFLKKFFRLWKSLMNSRGDLPPRGHGNGGGSAILASPMVTIQAVVVMVTVSVAMVTACVAMEI